MNRYLTPLVVTTLLVSQGFGTSFAEQAATVFPKQSTPADPPPPATSPVTPVAAPSPTPTKCLLAEGEEVQLTFDQDISSKTAAEGDPVVFLLANDLKVGEVVVAKSGTRAFGEVTNAKKSGMMGKAGELNIRLDYLKVGSVKVKLRGTKAKEGESGTTSAIVLTVLFGPIGLIKHGKNIDIQKGTALKVYVADDISLPPSA